MNDRSTFHVISLDPEGARYRAFATHNAHLGPIAVFRAIRGADIPTTERIASRLMTPELVASGTVTEGTVGCAASHRALWRGIAASGRGAVIMEDDVYTHPRLHDYVAANHDALNAVDIVLFGVNTNSILASISPQGVVSRSLLGPKHPDAGWIAKAFAATKLSDVRPHRLLNAFGLCCYWISATGAAKLLELCYPLTLEPVEIPIMPDKLPGSAIDSRLNAFFSTVAAYVTLPFLAFTPNNDSSTSV
jgi:GR25 family glycosyltransferase involved in LPS biosynthesis